MKTSSYIGAICLLCTIAACSSVPNSELAKTDTPNFSCYRQIYNNSSCSYTFSATTGGGNVYFGDADTPLCTQQNGPCTVGPGVTIGIKYTTTAGFSNGHISIFGLSYNQRFQYVSDLNQCPYIRHSGSTGAVSVNDPANGDFSSGSCN